MNLAIDIGNSFTHLAVYTEAKPAMSFKFPTHSAFNRQALNKRLSVHKNAISAIGISSVVPAMDKAWKEYAIKYFKLRPLFVNYKTHLPIVLNIKKPWSLGSDRICNSVFGYLYFKGKENVIIVDMGTANTYDVVLKKGYFTGGIIAPGTETSAKALNLNTGKLPELTNFTFGRRVIGKNTFEAIRSGLMNYPLFATEGIIKAIKKEHRSKFKVIITGGMAKTIRKKLSIKTIYIENTVLDGINLILNYNKTK